MKQSRARTLTGLGLITIISLTACTKQNEETLINNQGAPAACNTTNMKYGLNVLPIIQNNCYTCHGNGQTQGGVNLDGYDNLKVQVNNNALLNVITHAPGYPPMPLGRAMLSECDINKIKAWVNSGAENN